MSRDDDPAVRAAFEDECLREVRRVLADDSPFRHMMDGHGRSLRSLTLERSNGDAEIVVEMVRADGTSFAERYSVWHFERRPPAPTAPFAARETAGIIAVAIAHV